MSSSQFKDNSDPRLPRTPTLTSEHPWRSVIRECSEAIARSQLRGTLHRHVRREQRTSVDAGTGTGTRGERAMLNARDDLAGRTFGDLVAVEPTDARRGVRPSVVWLCRCTCGQRVLRTRQELLTYKPYVCEHVQARAVLRGAHYDGR